MSAAQSNQPDHGQRPASRTSTHRLAELVANLADCSLEQAVAAVEAVQNDEPVDSDAALEVVARAMSAIRLVDLRDKVDLRDTAEQHTPIS
jgi:hypothetical protein